MTLHYLAKQLRKDGGFDPRVVGMIQISAALRHGFRELAHVGCREQRNGVVYNDFSSLRCFYGCASAVAVSGQWASRSVFKSSFRADPCPPFFFLFFFSKRTHAHLVSERRRYFLLTEFRKNRKTCCLA